MTKIRDIHVVATVETPSGPSIVDCSVRPRDLEPDVLIYLREKAEGMHGGADVLPADFEQSDALGG